MTDQTPQTIGHHALARAVHFADEAATYAGISAHITEANAPLIATLGNLAAVYANIAKAAAVTATRTEG